MSFDQPPVMFRMWITLSEWQLSWAEVDELPATIMGEPGDDGRFHFILDPLLTERRPWYYITALDHDGRVRHLQRGNARVTR